MITDQYEYLMNNILGARTIFDVGAKDGRDTSQFLRIFPHANIWAFDCATTAIDRLEQSFGGNERVTIVPKAVADHTGREAFHVCTMRGSSGLFPVSDKFSIEAKNTECYDVDVITLDDFIYDNDIRKVDLLKIDIEGADYLAFQGVKDSLLAGRIRAIMCELLFYSYYDGQHYAHEIMSFMDEWGFSLHALWPQYWGGRLRYANALFM